MGRSRWARRDWSAPSFEAGRQWTARCEWWEEDADIRASGFVRETRGPYNPSPPDRPLALLARAETDVEARRREESLARLHAELGLPW